MLLPVTASSDLPGPLSLPRWLGPAAVAVVVALQLPMYAVGVRATADEVGVLTWVMQGWPATFSVAFDIARVHGRIGAYFMTLLNAFSSALADQPAWRLGFAALHFGLLLAFARYVAAVTRTATTVPLFMLLAALQPLAGDFLPPIAFPLQNTVPLLLLVLSRLALVQAAGQGMGGIAAWLARLLFVLALLSSEYACLVGMTMLAAEALARWHHFGPMPAGDRLRRLVAVPGLKADVACLVLVLATWVAFRLVHPSNYDGNTMDALLRVERVLRAAVGHVVAGTLFARFEGLATVTASPLALAGASMVALATAVGLRNLSTRLDGWPAPVGTALVALLGIALVTVPIVASAKYQAWCVDQGNCSYLDSRLSALALPVLLLSALRLLQVRLSPAHRRAVDGVFAVAIGVLAGVGFLVNAQDSRRLSVVAEAWQRAQAMACVPAEVPADNDLLLARIERGEVSIHPDQDRATYWRRYMAWFGRVGCDDADKKPARAAALAASRPGLAAGSRVTFDAGNPRAGRYLGTGWSQPESWGVWSEGERSTLFVQPVSADGTAAELQFEVIGFYPPAQRRQEVRVTVDGRDAATWTLDPGQCRPGCLRSVRLPEGMPAGHVLRLGFEPRFPRVPGEDNLAGETRRLGFALVEMRLLSSPH